ncbi:uncharacterized protein F5147DRAFT_716526 [Suillus discolor]|uniref:Uncharacterized protein n=1 Tax=Suillus discolor TaxID=1912936 RepID=A0A9P7EXJ1_9AGAM|nr:uncharacterized protein F5147DRAFT_716526 [Suillus discolor]KAG2096538.1 hypothetical protein F5147DRAFT_716526 [Suillus discolor]
MSVIVFSTDCVCFTIKTLPLIVSWLPLMLAIRARTWFLGISNLGFSTNTVYLHVSVISVFGTVVKVCCRSSPIAAMICFMVKLSSAELSFCDIVDGTGL